LLSAHCCVTQLFQDLSAKLSVQNQINVELLKSYNQLEQRLRDMHLENMHMHSLQVKQLMDEEEKHRLSLLLKEASNALSSLQKQYDEDMIEVQGLSKILQLRILGLQEELALCKEQGSKRLIK
jgi:uncharacterized protein YsxB (DUF464 family)